MIPVSRRLLAVAMACVFSVAAFAPARAAIETDPTQLYTQMRHAYDEGETKKWPFESELYYQATILDAGRAYSLFRPTDPNYAQVASLAVEVATQLHYNPLTSNDAALWYVNEAAAYVAKNGDQQQQALASALALRLDAGQQSPSVLAKQAEEDAIANVRAFARDGDARVRLLVTDVRAYYLTKDAAYRSDLLQHAADPETPLTRVPDPEYGQMFAIAASALTDPGFTDADRAAARAIKYRRDHTPGLQLIARVSATPRELRLTRTAPADEYFGKLKYSPIGVNNEVNRVNKYLDKGWGFRMEGDALQVDSAVEDWQKQYPHDSTLPAALLVAYQLLQRVDTDKTRVASARVKTILLVQYASTPQALKLSSS